MRRILGDAPYCIAYVSINDFKAYNNAYGFKSGDKMLTLLVNTVRKCATHGEFVGRVGGDSLIVVCDHLGGDKLCRGIIDAFAADVGSLYREVDANNGFIVATNNYGVVDCFPIASLSIAGISNRSGTYKRISEFSKAIAQLQEKCMGYGGNYYEIL
jgi:GGDEF domain-containing protein